MKHQGFIYTLPSKTTNNVSIWNMKQWCLEMFGPRWGVIEEKDISRDGRWQVLYNVEQRGYCWYFRREEDLMLFVLKYGNQ